ncbi:Stp1/IreP family PP2C-type Ser/Thr phosphatase [Pseudomonadota bacterium]
MNLKEVLQVAVISDTGRVRAHNEDSTGSDLDLGLVVLADGMGGYRGGEVASAIAVTSIVQETRKQLLTLIPGEVDGESGYTFESLMVRDAIIGANNLILTTAQEENEYQGMGTTLVAGLFYDDRVSIGHVGDSRCYRYREGRLEQLTGDHTVRQELIDRGFYTPEEAARTVSSNLVTRALGIDVTVDVDIYEESVLPEDIYLLCSDGLNDLVEDETISAIIEGFGADLEKTANLLVKEANANGGNDNISVVLVRPTKPFPIDKTWQSKLVDWFN